MGAILTRAALAVMITAAASMFSRVSAASGDGAGLFVLPPDRVAMIEQRSALERRVSSGIAQLKAVLPLVRQVQEFGVTPMMWGFTGVGVRVSGKM